MNKKLRILHYYWCQFDDNDRKGGGIKVYLNNVLPKQVEKNIDVYSLSSGVDYDIFNKSPHIVTLGVNKGIKKYSLFNSPIMAPSKADFYDKYEYLTNQTIKGLLKEFLLAEGPFDIIHFHSLEGIGVKVLELKEDFPDIKFVYSMHNYFPFCPQVNLWYQDTENCVDYNNGQNCTHCIEAIPSKANIKRYYSLITLLRKWHISSLLKSLMTYGKKYRQYIRKTHNIKQPILKNYECKSEIYINFRESNIRNFNKYIDLVICVSNRVGEISKAMGINKNILKSLYIGTDFAKGQAEKAKFAVKDGILKIAYAGYMRADKGFYFFLSTLEEMPADMAKKVSVVFAARNEDSSALDRINKLKSKFHSIEYYDGYTRDNFKDILCGVNLGVVPVMWEDNLPQVSMELKSMGIPVMATNLGGASELSSSDLFKVIPGDISDFISKINTFINNPDLLDEYYKNSIKLKTIDEHCTELDKIYGMI